MDENNTKIFDNLVRENYIDFYNSEREKVKEGYLCFKSNCKVKHKCKWYEGEIEDVFESCKHFEEKEKK